MMAKINALFMVNTHSVTYHLMQYSVAHNMQHHALK